MTWTSAFGRTCAVLLRAIVRWLALTKINPNVLTFMGLVVNAWAAFFRYYLLRGHYRSGWAGFIAARIHAFYAFLKYAKLYEATRVESKETRIPAAERKDS